jgi:alpha-tubulin N-acetyltransferase 1
LKEENKRPEKIAYDRPSPKLFGFLKKYYGLSKFIPQNNNFVIFDQYFMSFPESVKSEQKKV